MMNHNHHQLDHDFMGGHNDHHMMSGMGYLPPTMPMNNPNPLPFATLAANPAFGSNNAHTIGMNQIN
jgi:hypothetical protein